MYLHRLSVCTHSCMSMCVSVCVSVVWGQREDGGVLLKSHSFSKRLHKMYSLPEVEGFTYLPNHWLDCLLCDGRGPVHLSLWYLLSWRYIHLKERKIKKTR
jgi:hypothetical protein